MAEEFNKVLKGLFQGISEVFTAAVIHTDKF